MHPAWKIVSLASAGRVSTRLRPRGKVLYLTFDDGPHPDNTPQLISLLGRHDARATFFLVGSKVQPQQELTRALLEAGHRLGNHSFSHRRLTTLSVTEMLEELSRADEALAIIDGVKEHLFRPPWGRITAQQLVTCLASGRRVALWSRDSLDYKSDADEIVRLFRARPPVSGDVLLFHDDGPSACGALSRLLPEWKAAGFDLDPIPHVK
jgi:peptidoglycan-N-acetylglucosamine deacetylase